MGVFVNAEHATAAVDSGGGVFNTTVSYTTAVTPAGGVASPQYSTSSPDMDLGTGAGTSTVVDAAGTPMSDNLQLLLKPGHTKPGVVQIDIAVTSGSNTGHGAAVVIL